MSRQRLVGGALLAGLVALVAVQVPELVRNQGRQPFDRRLSLRREVDVEALAASSRAEVVRTSYAAWYALARELPDVTIQMTRDREAALDPLRGLGGAELRFVKQPLALKRRVVRQLRDRATLVVRIDGERLYVIVDPLATIYELVTVPEGWSLLLSREAYLAAGGELF